MKKLTTQILCAALVVAVALTFVACSKAETPLTAAELLDLGEKYLLELNYEQALVQFLEVIKVEPRNPRGYTGAAEAYIGLGDAAGAEAVLRKGLQALPDNAEIIDMARKLGIDVGSPQTSAPTPTATEAAAPTPTPPPIVYEAGDIIQFGDYDWRVLDVQDGRVLIITDEVIETRQYHNDKVIVTWEISAMRAYLNGEFLNNFSEADRARIADTNVENPNNEWFGAVGGNDTIDKIFLLNLSEVVRYFGDSGKFGEGPGAFEGGPWPLAIDNARNMIEHSDWERYGVNDQFDNARIARDSSGAASEWWLRSPGDSNGCAAIVDTDGYVSVVGRYVSDYDGSVLGSPVSAFNGGIRPALWLILE